jgi:hypothetical protein
MDIESPPDGDFQLWRYPVFQANDIIVFNISVLFLNDSYFNPHSLKSFSHVVRNATISNDLFYIF